MKLQHLALRGQTCYLRASHLQERLVQLLLASKNSSRRSQHPLRESGDVHSASPSFNSTGPPGGNDLHRTPTQKQTSEFLANPTIITAEFKPVYTCGRREISTVTPEAEAHLRCGGQAEFHEALRGGQTTFHGPGQLVAYPILDIKRHANLSAKCYVDLLEESVIRTCARYGIKGFRTQNPGVWTHRDWKICAVGVHLRRNVASHGIGLNVSTDLRWFDRIVACGLEGKYATSFEKEGVDGVSVGDVGGVFVEEFARRLGLSSRDVIGIEEKDIEG